MAVATVVINATSVPGHVKGTWTCDASPSATTIRCGFVPSVLMWWNVTDKDQIGIWSSGMAAATGMTTTTAAAAISANGITAVTGAPAPGASNAGTLPGTVPGFTIGTDAGVQEASKVFEFLAFR
jgi:hypothetical protein